MIKGLDRFIKPQEEKGASHETKMGYLKALNLTSVSGLNMYAGTVPPAEVARRRAKNKEARRARRRNRR